MQLQSPENLIPFRWPGEWQDPAALGLLRGTPLNCIVADDKTAKAVVDGARAAGIAVVPSAGNDAVTFVERPKAPADARGSVLAATGSVWPGIPRNAGAGGGPTGVPWVDSNGWYVQLANALAPRKAIWLAFDPPEKTILNPASYSLAVADSAAFGARWIVTLDPKLRAGLLAREARALETWKAIASTTAFFEARRAWRAYSPAGVLGVISDFTGPNEDMGTEILNLTARRALPYRIIPKSRVAEAPFTGLKALVYADAEAPDAALRKKLLAFAAEGGAVLTGVKFGATDGTPAPGDPYGRYNVRAVGKGRVAVAKEEFADPYLVAADVHLLMSHGNDAIHTFNATTANLHLTQSADGGKALLQVINYTMRPAGHPITVTLTQRYRAGRLWALGSDAPKLIETVPAGRGIELHLPPLAVYAGIELDK